LIKPIHFLLADQACCHDYKRSLDSAVKLYTQSHPCNGNIDYVRTPELHTLDEIVWHAVKESVPDGVMEADTRKEYGYGVNADSCGIVERKRCRLNC
jgi:hypothetical protein